MARSSQAKSVVEQCWTLVGERRPPFWHAHRTQRRRGERTSVECDAAWTLGREETRGDVVGFYHTHPDGPLAPSRRDDRTMRAWVSALGKPLLCLIESGDEMAAFRYDDDESNGIRLAACERFLRGVVVIYECQSGPPDERES